MTNDTDALFPEDELERALSTLRPDAARFERGVRRRLDGASHAAAPRWLRFAAGLLPAGAPAASVVVESKVATVGAKGTLKGAVPSLVAAPAVALVMLLLAFLSAVGTLLSALGPAGARRAAERDAEAGAAAASASAWRGWWRAYFPLAIVAYLVLGGVLAWGGADLFLLVIVVSMLGFALVLRKVGAAGYADRAHVGDRAFALLLALGLLTLQLQNLLAERHASVVLLAGALLCLALRGPAPRRRSQRVVMALATAPALLLAAAQAWPRSAATPVEMRAYVEGFDRFDDTVGWRRVASLARRLDELDVRFEAPDAARAALRSENGFVRLAALDAGLLRPEELDDASFPAGARRRLVGGHGAIPFLEQAMPLLLHVAADPALEEAERATLIERALSSWPEPSGHAEVHRARLVCDALAALGAEAALGERQDEVHALLVRSGTVDDDALRLMRRFGVPSAFDLAAAERGLEDAARPSWLFPRRRPSALVAAADLGTLRDRFGVPRRALVPTLVERRLLLAAALLVVLCAWATRKAPPAPRAARLTRPGEGTTTAP